MKKSLSVLSLVAALNLLLLNSANASTPLFSLLIGMGSGTVASVAVCIVTQISFREKQELAEIHEDAAAFIANDGIDPTPLLAIQIADLREQLKKTEKAPQMSDLQIVQEILKAKLVNEPVRQ